jgi:FKBP12-rapamycin complex-associated protein
LTWRLNNRESPPEPTFTSERRNSLMSGIESRNPAPNGVPESGRPDTYRPRNRSSAFAQKVDEQEAKEVQNARAIQVLARVKEKLTGRDFKAGEELKVDMQVDQLIREATNLENLCQHYIGWCSFW